MILLFWYIDLIVLNFDYLRKAYFIGGICGRYFVNFANLVEVKGPMQSMSAYKRIFLRFGSYYAYTLYISNSELTKQIIIWKHAILLPYYHECHAKFFAQIIRMLKLPFPQKVWSSKRPFCYKLNTEHQKLNIMNLDLLGSFHSWHHVCQNKRTHTQFPILGMWVWVIETLALN